MDESVTIYHHSCGHCDAFGSTSSSMPLLCSVCILLSSVAFCFALPDSIWRISSPSRVQSQLQTSFRQLYPHISQGKINVWEVVQLAVLGVLVPCLWYWKSNRAAAHSVEISTSGGTCEGKARKKMEIHGTHSCSHWSMVKNLKQQ